MGTAVEVTRLYRFRYEDGGLPEHQLRVLLKIVAFTYPSRFLEIGTFMGQTTAAIADCLPGIDIHTVDLPPAETVAAVPGKDKHLVDRRDVGREFRGVPCHVVQHLRNTLTWDFAEVGRPDFIFIDADHSYEGVRNDSEKTLALVGGSAATFMWHDCDDSHPGVVQLLEEWRGAGRDIRRIKGTTLAYWRKLT
jgi:predicted O-methyltransferase YrrM